MKKQKLLNQTYLMNYNPNQTQIQDQINEIERSLKLIIDKGQITEIRAIGKGKDRYTESGYFDDIRKMAVKAISITEYANGVYFIPNPINPDLLSRRVNQTQKYPENTTIDNDIIHRNWLLIDCDPERPTEISSTEAEHQVSLNKAREIREMLSTKGWGDPVIASSGNGAHLMYRIDLPVDDNGLVKNVLNALSLLFSDSQIKVDTSVNNPARIWKLYGTWARKGDDTTERPHRKAQILWDETPEELTTVLKSQLEDIARLIPEKPVKSMKMKSVQNGFDLEAWISKHNLDVEGPYEWNDGQKWILNTCPWNSDHTNKSAFILQFPNGAISAGCHHDGCRKHNWQSLRSLYEPDYEPNKRNFALTDYGNAERLVAKFGENIRYCTQQKTWYIWNGKHWTEDDTGELFRLAKRTVRSIYDEAKSAKDDDKRREIAQWAINSENEKRIKAMIELAQSEEGIPIRKNEMDSDHYLLNCQNGALDLKTGKLLLFNRDCYITKIIPIAWKGIDYSNDLWNNVLNDWTGGDDKMLNFLQCAVGYSITGDTREEVLFFIHGPTSTGKSTFIESIKNTLGEYTKTADFEAFLKRTASGGARNDIARLAGSRIVISIEVDKGKKLAESLIKSITGNDTITCRYLYKEAFEFKPTFALWLVANDSPDVDPDDEAMWRRILRVPLDKSIPKEKRNKNLKYELAEPEVCSAILTWAVNGCLKWQSEGIKIPASVQESTEDYRKEVDPFMAFFDEACVVKAEAWESTNMLYNAYQLWADNNGETKLINNKPLTHRLRKIGCRPKTRRSGGSTTRGWLGMKVLQEYQCPRIH